MRPLQGPTSVTNHLKSTLICVSDDCEDLEENWWVCKYKIFIDKVCFLRYGRGGVGVSILSSQFILASYSEGGDIFRISD